MPVGLELLNNHIVSSNRRTKPASFTTIDQLGPISHLGLLGAECIEGSIQPIEICKLLFTKEADALVPLFSFDPAIIFILSIWVLKYTFFKDVLQSKIQFCDPLILP